MRRLLRIKDTDYVVFEFLKANDDLYSHILYDLGCIADEEELQTALDYLSEYWWFKRDHQLKKDFLKAIEDYKAGNEIDLPLVSDFQILQSTIVN